MTAAAAAAAAANQPFIRHSARYCCIEMTRGLKSQHRTLTDWCGGPILTALYKLSNVGVHSYRRSYVSDSVYETTNCTNRVFMSHPLLDTNAAGLC